MGMSAHKAKYPDIFVQLSGYDGNAYSILGRVLKYMRNAGVPKEIRDEYVAEATAGDYDNLLRVTAEWVDVA